MSQRRIGPLSRAFCGALILFTCAGCASNQASSGAEDPPDATAHGTTADLTKAYRPHKGWKDTSEGVQATLIYMSASGTKLEPRPFPIIYSSDPNNTYFYREAGPELDVRRLHKDEMQRFLETLEGDGFSVLPWEDFGFRAKVSGKRALYLYRNGACQRVQKSHLSDDDKVVFTRVETRIIALNRAD